MTVVTGSVVHQQSRCTVIKKLAVRPYLSCGENSTVGASSVSQDLGVQGNDLSVTLGRIILGLHKTPAFRGRIRHAGHPDDGENWGFIDLDALEWKKFFVKVPDRPRCLRLPSMIRTEGHILGSLSQA